jgi:hypothetical protein
VCLPFLIREPLWKDQPIPFPHSRGLLPPIRSVDDDQDFVSPNCGIATQVFVVHPNLQNAVADHRLQAVGDIYALTLHAVVASDDEQVSRDRVAAAIMVVMALVSWVIVTVVSVVVVVGRPAIFPIVMPNFKQLHVNEAAFSKVKLARLIPSVPRKNPQSFVPADSGVSTHSLIVDDNPAVHPTARDQIPQNVGYVGPLRPESVVGSLNLPAFILCRDGGAEDCAPQNENEKQGQKFERMNNDLHD